MEVLKEFGEHFASHDDRPWKVRVRLPQEKFTDVAIASHLLRDFYKGTCTKAILVSNDSDLSPAVELAVGDGHTVWVFSPAESVSRDLNRVPSLARPLRRDLVRQCQMPDIVRMPDQVQTLERPAAWK
ncbi:MAG: NYN domain-containing protein [Actinobacteria bacterium]|nr:NYN domain-containing protein [Actinomycetota bacterium]MCB9390211.1 NYN domain-containing protein [Acidimicrobiia bacterium]